MFTILFACTGGSVGLDDSAAPTSTDTQDTGPLDLDGDGSPATEDCDDLDDRRYPGAEEVFDEVDNDCDGLVDADGSYTGTASMSASTTYEGKLREGLFDCPVEMSRSLAIIDFTITCPVTHGDTEEEAVLQLMMGTEMVITPAPGHEDVASNIWTGRATITSSAGWDTLADASFAWTDTASSRFSLTLDAAQLAMSGSGTATR